MRTGIDKNYQRQDQESLEELGTLPLPSNPNSRNNKHEGKRAVYQTALKNRKVKQAFLNKLSFQEHEQQQFLFINKSQKAPPSYPFFHSPLQQLCPPCKQDIKIIYTYKSVRSSEPVKKTLSKSTLYKVSTYFRLVMEKMKKNKTSLH